MNNEKELPSDNKGVHRTAFAGLLRSWIELTNEEQKAVLVVLALFILGLAVRVWHLQNGPSPSETAQERREIKSHSRLYQETFSGSNYPGKPDHIKFSH